MNREIKFRAFQDNQMLTSPISSNYGLQRFFGLLYEDAPIMQFTGLLDKNGKEIFEGDIVLCDRTYWDEIKKLIVEYDVQSASFYLLNKKDSVDSETFEITSCFCVGIHEREVIGNIFENPELVVSTAVS